MTELTRLTHKRHGVCRGEFICYRDSQIAGRGDALFVFEGVTRLRDRTLEYLHFPRIELQCFDGVETLRFE